MVALLTLPASAVGAADDLIVIPVTGFASGNEGESVTIATVDVAADIVGATCQITGSTVNQQSVHEGNDLLIMTGGRTFVVPNFEDAGFIMHEAGEVASIGPTIEVQIRFGPDGVSSGGFRIRVDCDSIEQPPTTPVATTTVEGPTTTEPSTTEPSTTEPSTTEPATTEVPPAGPTTEAPGTTTAPTTAPPSTAVEANPPTTAEEPPAGPTTEAPATTTTPTTAAPTTAAPTTETPPAGPSAEGEDSLPVTGSSTALLLGLGLVSIGAGTVLRRFATTA